MHTPLFEKSRIVELCTPLTRVELPSLVRRYVVNLRICLYNYSTGGCEKITRPIDIVVGKLRIPIACTTFFRKERSGTGQIQSLQVGYSRTVRYDVFFI